MANFGWETLVDLLKLGAGAALFATGVGAPAAAAALPAGFIGPPVAAGLSSGALGAMTGGAFIGLGGASGLAGSAGAPSDEELRQMQMEQARASTRKSYQRSPFMPQMGGNRYAPQNRPPQSGISPDIMAYLRKYIR